MTRETTPEIRTADKDDGPIVVWLRDDLRLDDNPALALAAETKRPIVPLVVLDEESDGVRALGGAHKWWLHHSLERFAASLRGIGSQLTLRRGKALDHVTQIVEETGATALFFNRRYDPASRAVDDAIEEALGGDVVVERFTANILHDPENVQTKTGGYYKVYTPFWKNVSQSEPRDPMDPPKGLKQPDGFPKSDDLADWNLLPSKPDWSGGFSDLWEPGEKTAHERFETFCDDLLEDYHNGRERPRDDATTRMSPHLRWGEISPYRLWHSARTYSNRRKTIPEEAIKTFLQELVWRDFNYHLLFHFGALATDNFNDRFDTFPWRSSKQDLTAWQKGLTGYPIVDAGMRQLWQKGWMHNRVRMIVGSFLTKDLLIDWRDGERWFWDTLVDGDIASNTSQWQWIGGSGADAQPFFRIFNPITQSERFDKKGAYIRQFVPELRDMPDKHIHAPWKAGRDVLEKAGVKLGETYPEPVVDHSDARDRALSAYDEVKG
ncbi:deoxyribodipyrimidine photo-lyase [Fulvimarina sp. 2208YS6-2-32]|uniref:Deoxyribodipyrimidine photo-lyase n=1 Tax=Fulvimarina uroteuthidis TaxID=3098149 RepID=A0ABU5I4Y5_9HYPH|nr:deoxyribodipyrimidine photo-lyase [Fulvimarina sp. 2208YS6-2-32]MDY8109793.1 deoxyribodipyrimidine photo-lyase [Fulvimarina sp. 2208YS6-2-32]